MPEYLPFPPPSEHKTCPAKELKEDQQEKYAKVLTHFSDGKYEVPGEKKGPLTEEEQFWIVSILLLRNRSERLIAVVKDKRLYFAILASFKMESPKRYPKIGRHTQMA